MKRLKLIFFFFWKIIQLQKLSSIITDKSSFFVKFMSFAIEIVFLLKTVELNIFLNICLSIPVIFSADFGGFCDFATNGRFMMFISVFALQSLQ